MSLGKLEQISQLQLFGNVRNAKFFLVLGKENPSVVTPHIREWLTLVASRKLPMCSMTYLGTEVGIA